MDPDIAQLEARYADTAGGDDLRARVDAMNALAWALRRDDVPRANGLARDARDLAREQGYTLGQARACRAMGMTMSEPEQVSMVFEVAREALSLFEQAGDRIGTAGASDFLASLHEHIGDIQGGMEYALSALRIAEEAGDPVRKAYALSSVGGLLAASHEVDAAVGRLEEALALFEAADERVGIETIHSRLCRVLQQAGRSDEALAMAEKGLGFGRAAANDFLVSSAYKVMADVAAERGDGVAAEDFYRQSLGAFDSGFDRNNFGIESAVALARLLLSRGALDAAEAELVQLLSPDLDPMISVVGMTSLHEALAEVYEQKRDHEAALRHLREAKHLREGMLERNRRSELAQVEMRAALDAAKRDADNERLRFAELRAVQAELVEAEKMALLGKLAAGMAHELNTPLGVLTSNLHTVQAAIDKLLDAADDPAALRALAPRVTRAFSQCAQTSTEAIERLGTIGQSFSRFSHLDQAERRRFDVREGLDSALMLLAPTTPKGIEIRRDYASVPEIPAWPRELNLAFLTVIQNAIQAIDGAGAITLCVRPAPPWIEVVVSDTGRGMTAEQRAGLFDVGFGDAGDRKRMRVGLPAAAATLRKHGGTITVASALGRGTAVTFRLRAPSES